MTSSISTDWYTPPEIIALILRIQGTIELDPCAEPEEPYHVPAQRRIAPPEDGLAVPWIARSVYMNPPYGREILRWISKLHAEVARGNVIEAIALVPTRTDTVWWRVIQNQPVCHIHGRLKFDRPHPPPEPDQEDGPDAEEEDGPDKVKLNSATFPSSLIYWGAHPVEFAYHCQSIGSCYRPY